MINIHDLPHDACVRHPKLPKSALLSVSLRGFDPRRRKVAKMRFANAVRIEVFGIEIVIRRPWLAGPVRQLHPELFAEEQPHE